jgi:3-methylfumaryl-CoA hydratase
LTFNGHRIHCDRTYATEVEGYPGLVFHGPMQATLLVEYASKLQGSTPATFSHRGVRPLFDNGEFSLNANSTEAGFELWTANASGVPTMKAVAKA